MPIDKIQAHNPEDNQGACWLLDSEPLLTGDHEREPFLQNHTKKNRQSMAVGCMKNIFISRGRVPPEIPDPTSDIVISR
ncbi:hypothetical protein KER22_20050 [Escherichia coli]|nr:hypothetical protein A1S5_04625 [Escherichia coli KTE48]MBS9139617.1 hypothetical protein [Escherichia coli]MBS9304939.1 hypothetical protein [Escherichia coli]TXO63486.1 hypothetical protein FV246_24525 [Escherichia coli]